MVASSTNIRCDAWVHCPYDEYQQQGNSWHLLTRRRDTSCTPSDWGIEAWCDGTARDGQVEEIYFPRLDPRWTPGQNTNLDEWYYRHSSVIITPIYGTDPNADPPQDPDTSWASKVIGGPNDGKWYNVDSSLYAIDRIIWINKWCKPFTPAPAWWQQKYPGKISWFNYQYGIIPYWPKCRMWNEQHLWHTGCEAHEYNGSGVNWQLLGHWSRIESYLSSHRDITDACYMVEDHVYDSLEALRAANEIDRANASEKLREYTQQLHIYTDPGDCAKHNWAGKFYYWEQVNGNPVLLPDATHF